MSSPRIALYIGNEIYPGSGSDPCSTIRTLQSSPLTSPILGLLNKSGHNPDLLVYNDASNPLFNTAGDYLGSQDWPSILADLRGGNIRECYLSFSTNGTQYMADLLRNNHSAAMKILTAIKQTLGFDGIDLDYESGNYSPSSPIYPVAEAAVAANLKVTAAPFGDLPDWTTWVKHVQSKGGDVAWLNLQCYAGGIYNNPGDWNSTGVPIVAGSCNDCCCPQTDCTPSDMQNLYTLWRTGQGDVSSSCWKGTANTSPQNIGGGFIWVYSSIKGRQFPDYMNALKAALGL
ncbi:MAG: hypothetical protein Tsb002_32100 [Wenzhouxiangellaceae bacterium]